VKQAVLVLTVLALGAGAGAPSAAAAPPDMMYTGNADQISDTSARIVGYGHSVADSCWFDYGPTTAYGKREDVVCSGTTYGYLTGLTPGTVYHYRFAGQNADGPGCGIDKTFATTGTAPPGSPPPDGSPAPCSPPPPGVTPPPGGPTAPAVELSVAHQSLSRVLRKGLRLQLTLSGSCPCKVSEELLLPRRTARRFGIRTTSTYRVLGRGSRGSAVGFVKQTIRVKASLRKKLRSAHRLGVKVRATVVDPSGDRKVVTRSLTLKRS
jgi:hypothetical protein